MICPYCQQEMHLGDLRSEGGRAVYWLPRYADLHHWLLTKKAVEDSGGLVLDQLSAMGFFAKERPSCYCCRECRVLIAKL